MRVVNRRPTFLILSILSFYMSSFSIAFMPLVSPDIAGERRAASNTLAAVFWVGLILALVCTYRVMRQRRWDIDYMPPQRVLPHPLRFFSNKPAIVFDSMLIVSVIIYAAAYPSRSLPAWLAWELLFVIVFSLEMHFVFNGKNYEWLRAHAK